MLAIAGLPFHDSLDNATHDRFGLSTTQPEVLAQLAPGVDVGCERQCVEQASAGSLRANLKLRREHELHPLPVVLAAFIKRRFQLWSTALVAEPLQDEVSADLVQVEDRPNRPVTSPGRVGFSGTPLRASFSNAA